jgi:hypothetical protein
MGALDWRRSSTNDWFAYRLEAPSWKGISEFHPPLRGSSSSLTEVEAAGVVRAIGSSLTFW